MDRLTSMTVFARVASTRSFSAAARQLGISQATASKHVQTLEGWIGARLLHRTTRRVGLTEAGETFFAQCTRILEDMEAARQAGTPEARLRGTLRVSAPVVFGSTRLAGLAVEFMRESPELSLSVTLCGRPVDVIEEGYDVAIRISRMRAPTGDEPGLTVQRLGTVHFAVCASPGYVAVSGAPETPDDLAHHECLMHARPLGDIWRFIGPEGETEVAVVGRLKSDSGQLRREAACRGGGIVLAPDYLIDDDVAAGRLVRLMPDYQPVPASLDAVSSAQRGASPKVRSFTAFLAARLGE
ncbi:MAG TPA: LysR family transcriptional regulator [Acetobacteraceae bacterium]|jgi:DNA-binding transcriptional LysR family regulator